jgi:hypothetical protein
MYLKTHLCVCATAFHESSFFSLSRFIIHLHVMDINIKEMRENIIYGLMELCALAISQKTSSFFFQSSHLLSCQQLDAS